MSSTSENALRALLVEVQHHMHHPFHLSGLGFTDLRTRIDAALAAPSSKELPYVTWMEIEGSNGEAFDAVPSVDTVLRVTWFANSGGYWRWSVDVECEDTGRAATFEEAKAAALEAWRRLE